MTEQLLDRPQIRAARQQMRREGVAQRVGCDALGKPEADPQPTQQCRRHRGMQAAAAHTDEERPVGLARIRAAAQIGVERAGNNRQHRHFALAAALAPHPEVRQPLRAYRQIAAVEPERLADPEPAAPEQQQKRPVARHDPPGGALAGHGPEQVERLILAHRARQAARHGRGAQMGERRVVQAAAPVEEAEEASDRGDGAHGGAAVVAAAVAVGEPGAEIGEPERGKIPGGDRPAQMPGEKGEELCEIVPVGAQRAGRQAALVPQPVAPGDDAFREIGRGVAEECAGVDFGHPGHHDPGASCVNLRASFRIPMSLPTVPVLVPVPLDSPFDYLWPFDREPRPGMPVEVPFGPRRLCGVVWHRGTATAAPRARLRPVARLPDCPPLPEPLLRLVEWTARQYLVPLGAVLKLALPVPAALEPPRPRLGLAAAPGVDTGGLTAARRRVVETALAAGGPLPAAELARRAGAGPAVVRALVESGLLVTVPLAEPAPPAPDPELPGPELSPAQRAAAAALVARVRARCSGPVVLEGVPGSGKTEVYAEAVAETLRLGRRVLVLLPEIALSAQWLARFTARFGAEPVVWHSGLSAADRRRNWRRIALGSAPVVVGARSALFLPLPDIGLVVVDEEHDPSFKQDEGAVYDARAGAIERARFDDCPVVLASATPCLESRFRSGAAAAFPPPHPPWPRLVLPARHGAVPMPEVRLVDLRRERPPRGGFLAPPLREGVRLALDAGEQALLFLNRRGYAPLTLCRACGHRLRCPNCSAWLVLHRLRRRLQCHHCGWSRPEPEHCPHCGTVDALAVCGPGVERVAEEVQGLFPDARVLVATSDTVRTAADAEALVEAVLGRRVDVLVGTQILAKGHHFPALTMVGVVDADLGLAGGDLHAAERTFQLLCQVAGRAGRAERPGRVLIQTHDPDHPVMRALAAGDADAFVECELAEREAAGMPPFGRLAALVVSGRDAARVGAEARRLVRAVAEPEGVRILGPAPAPLALLRGRYRERILVAAAPGVDLPAFLRQWIGGVRLASGVRLLVDVDPRHFL